MDENKLNYALARVLMYELFCTYIVKNNDLQNSPFPSAKVAPVKFKKLLSENIQDTKDFFVKVSSLLDQKIAIPDEYNKELNYLVNSLLVLLDCTFKDIGYLGDTELNLSLKDSIDDIKAYVHGLTLDNIQSYLKPILSRLAANTYLLGKIIEMSYVFMCDESISKKYDDCQLKDSPIYKSVLALEALKAGIRKVINEPAETPKDLLKKRISLLTDLMFLNKYELKLHELILHYYQKYYKKN